MNRVLWHSNAKDFGKLQLGSHGEPAHDGLAPDGSAQDKPARDWLAPDGSAHDEPAHGWLASDGSAQGEPAQVRLDQDEPHLEAPLPSFEDAIRDFDNSLVR